MGATPENPFSTWGNSGIEPHRRTGNQLSRKDQANVGRSEWRATMECYVGLDASLKKTSICVVDGTGKVLCEGVVDSQPGAIARFLNSRAPSAVRIGIERDRSQSGSPQN